MNSDIARQAAAALWALRNAGETINALPAHCKPESEDAGRQAQIHFPELADDTIAGGGKSPLPVRVDRNISVSMDH